MTVVRPAPRHGRGPEVRVRGFAARAMRAGAVGAFWLLAACAQIVGADGYKAEGVPDQGAGGGGGSGGGGTGGGGGGGGSPAACGKGPAPREDIVRACVLRDGCHPLTPSNRMSNCITYGYPVAYPALNCLMGATGCNQANACQGYGYATADCQGKSKSALCIGNRATYCDPSWDFGGYYFDCTKRGGTCEVGTDASGTVARCKVKSTCSQASGQDYCDGSVDYECIEGKGYGMDCQLSNMVCWGTGSAAGCYFKGDPCAGVSAKCNGAQMDYCAKTGQQFHVDCGQYGGTCVAETDDLYCVAPGCTVGDVKNCKESCDGTAAVVCAGGGSYRIECTKYGFKACRSFKSDSLGDYVKCTPY